MTLPTFANARAFFSALVARALPALIAALPAIKRWTIITLALIVACFAMYTCAARDRERARVNDIARLDRVTVSLRDRLHVRVQSAQHDSTRAAIAVVKWRVARQVVLLGALDSTAPRVVSAGESATILRAIHACDVAIPAQTQAVRSCALASAIKDTIIAVADTTRALEHAAPVPRCQRRCGFALGAASTLALLWAATHFILPRLR